MMSFKHSALAFAICSSISGLAFAEEPAADDIGVEDLEIIVVSGSKTEKPLKDVAGSISVVTAEDIEKQSINDMSQLFKYDPSITVTGSVGGAQNIVVRGMGGDRVLMIKDGMRMNEGYGANGRNDFVGRGFVETDTLKQVEIAKGAASSLYGSDALGGIIVFTTKDASDYLEDGEKFAADVKAGYSSVDSQAFVGTTLALETGNFEQLLSLTYRDGEEEKNYDENNSPFEISSYSALYKAKYNINSDNFISFTADVWDQETIGDSADGLLFYFRTLEGYNVIEESSNGDKNSTAFKLDYQSTSETPIFDFLSMSLYNKTTDQEDQQYGYLDINADFGFFKVVEKRHMWQTGTYKQDTFGFISNATKSIGQHHTIGYGLDIETTESQRSVHEFRTVEGKDEPTKDLTTDKFPVNDVFRMGVFINDEISLLNDKLLITPGVRFDSYEMDPNGAKKSDGTEFVAIEENHTSFNLGALYKIQPDLAVFAQYGQGFKVPAYDLAYIEHEQVFSGYIYNIVPSDDLSPEESDTFEIGMRGHVGNVAFTAAVYYNKFDNFLNIALIDSEMVDGPHGPAMKETYQYQNIEAVTIKGAELGINYYLGDTITLFANAAYQDGTNDETDEYINSINPLMGTAGITYQQDNWSTDLILNWADRMTKVNEGNKEVAGYGTLDWLANWQITEDLTMNVSANNLLDKKYVKYQNASGHGVTADLTMLTEPGRHFAASIKYSF